MKIIKFLLILIVGIIAVVLIAAIFIPKTYHVERSVVISAPQPLIMEQIKSLKNMNEWSPFVEMDPAMQITYSGTEGEVGSSSSWKGEQAGEGTQTITNLTSERLDTRLDFKKPFESTSTAFFQTANNGSDVKVTWGMDGSSPYPMNVMNVFMDNMMGKEFEKGLTNLKTRSEKMAMGASK